MSEEPAESDGAEVGISKILLWCSLGMVLLLVSCAPLGFGLFMTVAAASQECDPASSPGVGGGAQDLKPGEVPKKYVEDIKKAAKVSGVPASVLAAQLKQESGFNPKACSSAGACGIGQFIPETWEKYSHGADRTDGHAGIRAQGEYMRDLMNTIAGVSKSSGKSQVELALAAYNAGEGAVLSYRGVPPYAETQNYVKTIMASAKSFKLDSASGEPTSDPSAEGSAGDEGECHDNEATSSATGGKTTGKDDYPWAGTAPALHPESGFYYRQCTDFAWWRLNQQLGGSEKNIVVTNTGFVRGTKLGNGGEWDEAWRQKGWPVDKKPQVGAMAVFKPGVSGADPEYGHIAVVKEVHGSQVVIEEYNALNPLGYGTRKMDKEAVSYYLHIPDSAKKGGKSE